MPNVLMPYGDKFFPQNILDTFNSYGLHPVMLKIDEFLNQPSKGANGDLIFFDFTRFSKEDGFLSNLAKTFPTIPIIVSHIEGELSSEYLSKLENVIDFVEQPAAVTDICNQLIIVWNAYTAVLGRVKLSTSGLLSEQNLIDIINIFATGKLSGTARLQANNRGCVVWFHDGNLIDVQFGDLDPVRALNKVILWNNGTFDMQFTDVEREARISEPTSEIVEKGKDRIRRYFIKKDALPSDTTRLFAITEYSEEDYSEEERDILKHFKMGKTLASYIATCAIDELEALDLIAGLLAKKAILFSDIERDEMDEQNRGLGGIINRISSFFKKDAGKTEEETEIDEVAEGESADGEGAGYKLRFARAQLNELASLVREKL